MKALKRRDFLKVTGLSAGMLPLMSGASVAQSAAVAKRVVVVVVPNGYTSMWLPNGSGANFSIKAGDESPLKPLQAHKERLLIVGGIKLQHAWDSTYLVSNDKGDGPGKIGGHAVSPMMLTGHHGVDGPSQPDGWKMTAGGPSVDVHIANNLPGAENLRFKPLAMRATKRHGRGFISYQGAPLTPGSQNTTGLYDDMEQLYKDMFGDGKLLEGAELAKAIAGKKHILDHTTSQLQAMHNHFGAENKLRIESHLEAVRRVTETVGAVNACEPSAPPPSGVDYQLTTHNPNYDKVLTAQAELASVALACDLTRSVTLFWSDYANNNISFPFLANKDKGFNAVAPEGTQNGGQIRTHHNIAHHDKGKLKNYSDQFYVDRYAHLMNLLTETTDAEGRPLIETTVVVFANMQEGGSNHKTENLTWILGGNFDGYFKTGRYVPWASGKSGENIPHNRILTSLINGVGCPQVGHFGEAEYGGEIQSLKA